MLKTWLLQEGAFPDLERRYAELACSAEHVVLGQARIEAKASQTVDLHVSNGVARIPIVGVLTPEYDWVMDFMSSGYTSNYADVQKQVELAVADSRVESLEFFIDSPGGQVDGLFEISDLVSSIDKPKTAVAKLAASAAYLLATAVGNIKATGPAATFGSVGVLQSYRVDANKVDVTSTEAPDKAPDPTTENGKSAIRQYLDQLHAMLVGNISANRAKTTGDVTFSSESVNQNFGRGGVFLAQEALRRGMIDSIATTTGGARGVSLTTSAQETVKTMDKKKLKAEFPELYEAVVAEGVALGRVEGAAQALNAERDRVGAHLEMGKAAGAMDDAVAAIVAGDAMTQTMMAKYSSKMLLKRDRQSVAEDVAAVASAAAGARAPVKTESKVDDMDEVAAAMEAERAGLMA